MRRYRWFLWLVLMLLAAGADANILLPNDKTTAGTRTYHEVPMSDGTLLATDVYLPPGDGPFPAILVRSTYSRNQGMNSFINKGYAAVIQDVRGMFNSQGEAHVFYYDCLLYTSPSPRDRTRSRMPSSA